MSQLPSENTLNNETAKPVKQKRERKQVTHRRGRSITVEVTLSGEVAKWAKAQAEENFRTVEGQLAYCVKVAMEAAK